MWNACVSDWRQSFLSLSLLWWYCLVTVVLIESLYGGTSRRLYFSSSWFVCICLLEILTRYIIQRIHKRMVRFQKLTRNLFLTLHGHNLHRQQRQLSKFLMRYQQFASHAYCGAAGPVSKMVSQQEKAFCVLHFEVSRSVITVHC